MDAVITLHRKAPTTARAVDGTPAEASLAALGTPAGAEANPHGAGTVAGTGSGTDSGQPPAVVDQLVNWLVSHLPPRLQVVDQGGGQGNVASQLRQRGHAVTPADGTTPDDGTADLALALGTLAPGAGLPAAVQALQRRLRPGGALLVSLPPDGGALPAHAPLLQALAASGLVLLQVIALPEAAGLFMAAVRPEPDGRPRALQHALAYRLLKLLHPGLMANNGIELTNLCNLRCKLCPTPTTRAVTGYATDDTVTKALTYTAPGTHFSFHRLGEPLMHPRLVDYVRWTRERGVTPLISTNGLLLTQPVLEQLIEAGVGNLQITFHTSASVKAYALAARHWLANPGLERQVVLVGNALSHQTEVPKWLDHHQVTPDERRFIRQVPSHNWAGNVPGTRVNFKDDVVTRRQKSCYYINNNIASVRWDGLVVGCCFDSENDNVVGHLDDYPTLSHKPKEYRLCRTCDPNWANEYVQ